jgi:hypothetical protein
MQLSTIQKLGGFSVITGSVLLFIYSACFFLVLPFDKVFQDPVLFISNANYGRIAVTAFVAVNLLIFGFASVYSELYSKSGLVGLLGFIFIELAYILQACKISWEIFLYPVIIGQESSLFLFRDMIVQHSASVGAMKMLSSAVIFIGILLFCISLLRSKVFSRTAAVLIFVGALLYGLGPMIGVIIAICGVFILSIGCSMLGWKLIRK